MLRVTYRWRDVPTAPPFSVELDLADHGDDCALAYATALSATPDGCELLEVTRRACADSEEQASGPT